MEVIKARAEVIEVWAILVFTMEWFMFALKKALCRKSEYLDTLSGEARIAFSDTRLLSLN